MITTYPSTIRETGCVGIELAWDSETAHRARQLVIDATGSDCFHEPGDPCFLLAGWLKRCDTDRLFTPERAGGAHELFEELTGQTCGGAGSCGLSDFIAPGGQLKPWHAPGR